MTLGAGKGGNGKREESVFVPPLTVGLRAGSWPRLELSNRLGEAGVAMQLGSRTGPGWASGPERGFIQRWADPFSRPQRSQEHRELRDWRVLVSQLGYSLSKFACFSAQPCVPHSPSLKPVAALCPTKHTGMSVTALETQSRVCPHL